MYRVLIVDDEEPVLESYGFILESGVDGFSLAGKARSGYEAIKLVYELKPDVVFMDINMPGIDGLDTIANFTINFRIRCLSFLQLMNASILPAVRYRWA
ncbi:MAG TPA: response regulator [Treponemataceae bacterium]|nr:response regulator [Treponemataceae bacterium]